MKSVKTRAKYPALRQEEARLEIVKRWNEWPERPCPATGDDMYFFFVKLKSEYPELFTFRTGIEDRWQKVHRWLNGAEQAAGRPH